jgi:hypothetical protein
MIAHLRLGLPNGLLRELSPPRFCKNKYFFKRGGDIIITDNRLK